MAVCKHASPLQKLTYHMGSVLPATHLYPSQLRLVLDLVTPEGCQAEQTSLAWLHTNMLSPSEEVTNPSTTNRVRHRVTSLM